MPDIILRSLCCCKTAAYFFSPSHWVGAPRRMDGARENQPSFLSFLEKLNDNECFTWGVGRVIFLNPKFELPTM